MTAETPVSIAIVGAGPSGFYAAEALLRGALPCQIDLIEGLPTPYGLVRGGVAPDHQSTKRVTKAYAHTADDPRVAYFGNVAVGRDVTLDALRAMYDAIVLAVGAPLDQALKIPGGDKQGIYGSAEFVGWYNGHPFHRDLNPLLDTPAVAVVGNGNVALDVARVLVKTDREMAASDLPDYAAAALRAAPIRDVYLIGRRGPVEAKFTNVELREMGRLQACAPVVDPAQLPDEVTGEWSDRDRRLREKNLATFREFAAMPQRECERRVHFVFYARPLEALGGDRVEALRLERTRVEGGRAVGTGETFTLPCGLVVAAIGYRTQPLDGVPVDPVTGTFKNREGRIAKGFYVVGWARRGPSGVIGTNKPDGAEAAACIAADFKSGRKPGRSALVDHLEDRGVRWVSFDDWRRLDAAEVAFAPDGAPRRKLSRVEDMLTLLGKADGAGQERSVD
jgi:NADPH-dependent glutamate synthase beta subunit-like oxidoreductase